MRTLVAASAAFVATALMALHAQQGSDLMRLTVPAGQLPAGCGMSSTEGAPVLTNPAIVTDPKFLAAIHSLIFDPRAGGPSAQDEASKARLDTAAQSMAARADQVEVGYAAIYREEGGFDEIGVFALRLKTPPAETLVPDNVRTSRITKGSVVVISWVDGRPASPDVGCVDVIRRHISSVELT